MQSSAYGPSKFKGSHTDAVKSAQNKKASSYFAFQFNISENWQHVASLSPRFVTPTWLTSFAVQRAATWLRNWGFPYQIPQVSAHSKRVSCSSSPPPPLPSFSACPSRFSHCPDFLSWSSIDLSAASLCFVFLKSQQHLKACSLSHI